MQRAEGESPARKPGEGRAHDGDASSGAGEVSSAQAWREQLLQGLLTVSLITLSISAPIGVTQTRGYHSIPTLVITAVLYTSVAVATFARRAPYVLRTLAMLAALSALSFFGFLRVGFLVGPGVGCALLVVVTGLLLGHRVMWIIYALTLGAMGGFAWLHHEENLFLEIPHIDPTQVSNWVRESAMYGLLTAVLATSVTFVVQRIQRILAERTATLEALRAEQAQRKQTETALDEAHGALEQMQRLEVVGRLAGGVAHDFNNALVVILGWADALRRMDDEQRRRRALDEIVAAGSRAARLTQQLLTVGRKAVTVPTALAPGPLIEEVARFVERVLPENIRLRTQVADDTPAIFADASVPVGTAPSGRPPDRARRADFPHRAPTFGLRASESLPGPGVNDARGRKWISSLEALGLLNVPPCALAPPL